MTLHFYPPSKTPDRTMAPMIPIRAEETLKTIENVLKRGRDTSWILKEKKS
jgi:hypothetical protein